MSRYTLGIALCACVSMLSAPAHARFGKSDKSDDDDSKAPRKSHPAAPARSSGEGAPHLRHERPPREAHHDRPAPRPIFWRSAPAPVIVVADASAYPPPPPPLPLPPSAYAVSAPASFRFEAGVEAQGHAEGGAVGFGLRLEGRRLGLHSEYGLILARSPGADEVDAIGLFDVHLTYALLSGERGRLRLEGGIDYAAAPQLRVVGPDVGVSAQLRLFGPLGVEAAVYYTPLPYLRLGATAGATLTFGHLALRGGVRACALDDQGLVDGVHHTDSFAGPYAGVALVF